MDTATCLFPPNHSTGRSRSSSSSSTTTNGVTLRRRSPRKRKAPAAYNTLVSTSSASSPNNPNPNNNNHNNNHTKQPRVLAELVTFCDEGTYWNEVKRKRPLVTDPVQPRRRDGATSEETENPPLPPEDPKDRVDENEAPPPRKPEHDDDTSHTTRTMANEISSGSKQRSPLFDKAVVSEQQQQQQQQQLKDPQQRKTKNRMMNVNDVMILSTKYNNNNNSSSNSSNNSNSSTNEDDASIAVTTETTAEEHSVASSVSTINTTTISSSSGPMILPSASKKVNTATNKTMPDTPTTKLATVTRDEDDDDNDDDDDAKMEVSPSSTSAAAYHAHAKGGDRTDDRSGSSIRWARKTTQEEDDVAPLMPSHSISSPSFSSPVIELENGARSNDDPAAAAGAIRSPPRSHARVTMMRMSKAPSTGKKTPVRAASSRPSPGATLTKKTPSSILRRRCTPVKSGDIADGTIRERAAVEPTSDQHFDALVAFACPASTSISMDGAAADAASSSAAVSSPSNEGSTSRRPIATVKAATTAGDAANTTQVIIMDCHTLGQQLELLFPEKFLPATEQHQLPRTTTAVGNDTGSRVIQLRRVPVRRCNVSSTLRHTTTEPDSPPCILPRLIACYTLYRDQQNQRRPPQHSPQHKRRRSSMLTNVSIFPILHLLQQLVDLEWTTLEGHEHQGEDGEDAAFLSPTHSDATTNGSGSGSGTYQDFFPPDGIVNCWNNNSNTSNGFDTATTNAVITQGSDTDTVDGADDTTTTTIAENRGSRKSQRRVQFAAFDETAVVRAPVDVLEGSYKPQEKCVHALLAVLEAVAELFPTAVGGRMSTSTTTTAATTILRDIILYLDTEFVALKHDKLCVESMYEMNEQSIPIRRIEKAAIAYSKSFTSLLDPLGRLVPQTYATACATTINGGHDFGSDTGGKNSRDLPKATLTTIIPIRLERVHTFVRSRPLSWECRLANASAQLVRYWLRTILNPIPGRADFETKTDQWSSRLFDYVKLTETEESYTTFEDDDDHDDDGGMSCATDDSSVETLDDDNVSSLLSNALGHVYMYLNLESWGALSWKERLLRVLPDPSCCATVVCREGIGTNKKPTYLTEKDWMEVEEQLTIASDFCAFHRRAVFVERLLSVIVKLDWKDRWSDTVQSAAHKLVRLNLNKISTGTRNDSDTIHSNGNHSNTTAGIYDAFGNSSIIIQPEDLHLLLLGMPMQDLLDRLRTDVIPLSRARYEICHPNLRATEGNFRLGLRNTKMKQKYLPRIKYLEETWSEWLHPGTNFPSISYTGTIPRYFNTDDDDDDDDDGS